MKKTLRGSGDIPPLAVRPAAPHGRRRCNRFRLRFARVNVPSLPQLPPSSTALKALWPRLQKYSIQTEHDPLWSICKRGADYGDEAAAAQCMAGWNARVPGFRDELAEVRRLLEVTWPSELNGEPYSGTYLNEADFEDPGWQTSQWGTKYPRLLALKKRFDPQGLFYGHHAVGSELWDATGNCQIPV